MEVAAATQIEESMVALLNASNGTKDAINAAQVLSNA